MTFTALQTFQANHVGPDGYLLKPDNDLGPMTRWAQDVETLHSEQRTVIFAALSYRGVRETPPNSNRHPRIDPLVTACRRQWGVPYCACGLSEALSSVREIRYAGALGLVRMLEPIEEPEAACAFSYPTGGGRGHCGLVTGVSATEVMTFEFNVNGGCSWGRRSREGLTFGRWVRVAGKRPGVVARAPFFAQAIAGTR